MSTAEDRYYDAINDRIALAEEEREAAESRANRNGFEQGDHVTVGKGTQVHTITGFGVRANGTHYAILWRAGCAFEELTNCDRLRAAP